MKKQLSTLGFSLIVVVSACNRLPATNENQVDLATAVAATLAAVESDNGQSPTEVPEATAKNGPTATAESQALPSLSMESFLLAYSHNGDLWTISGDGSANQLTRDGDIVDVIEADDRQVIVYVRQSYQPELYEVRAVNADGSHDRQILSQDILDSLYPLDGALHYQISQMDFIPGSHTLLFNTRAVFEGPGLLKNDDLHSYDLNSGERARLIEREHGGDFTISPDGRLLAIAQADSLALANIDGSGLKPDLVTFQPIITYSEYQYYPPLVWAPDSSRFGVFLPSSDPLADSPSGTVWVIPTTGAPISFAPILTQAFFPQSSGHSLLSPDLQQVAYLRDDVQSQAQVLFLANVDGSHSQIYSEGDIQWIGWATDGSVFSYRSDGNSLILGRPGSAPQPLTEGRSLRWLSSNLYLAQAGQHGEWTLKLGQAAGGTRSLVQPAGETLTYDIR